MLEVVTQTALLRRLPPQLYVRLCNQLQDNPEQTKNAADYLVAACQNPPIPLLYEYVLNLSLETKSLMPLENWLGIWSEESWKIRSPQTKHLMAYLAKGFDQLQALDDYRFSAKCIVALAQQALEGSTESEFVVLSLGTSPVAPKLLLNVPKLATDLQAIHPRFAAPFGPNKAQGYTTETITYTPGRTFRLLWLDEFISNCVLYPGNQLFVEQLDILWPNEKTPTLAFELALTAFDAYASALTLQSTRTSVWKAFISKKLPLIFRFLAKGSKLDSSLTRLLTTMDKEVSAAVDAHDMRLDFTRTCIDLQLCEPAVLHVLHRDYQPREENLDSILGIPAKDMSRQLQQAETTPYSSAHVVKLIEALPTLRPLALEFTSQELYKFVRNNRANLRMLAWFSMAFLNNIESCDYLCMHVPVKSLITKLINRLDSVTASDAKTVQIYGDIGAILIFIRAVILRYDVHVSTAEQQSGWSSKILFQEPTSYSNYEDMTPELKAVLDSWITSLAGGRGIGDSCLKAPAHVFTVFPALIKQLVMAFEKQLIAADALKAALEQFVQPALVTCLPFLLRVLLYNIWAQLNIKGNIAALGFFLSEIDKKSQQPDFQAVLNAMSPALEQFNNFSLKVGNIQPLITRVLGKSHPVTFAKLEIQGSFNAAFHTYLKGLVQWQNEPVGLPIVDGRLFEMGSQYFGKDEIMKVAIELLSSAPQATSTEIQVAIAVLYYCCLVKQVNSTHLIIPEGLFTESITETAASFVSKFHVIYEKHLDMTEQELPGDDEPDASIFDIHETAAVGVPQTAPPAATEPMLEADSSFNYGLDMDIGGPMGMDELDDAMGW